MEESLRNLFEEGFPAVSARTRAQVKGWLSKQGADFKWFYSAALKTALSQGDIVFPLPAFFWNGEKVKTNEILIPGILLEHTCDMSVDGGKPRVATYSYAPLLPLQYISKQFADPQALTANAITHKLFVGPIPKLADSFIADLNIICTVDSNALHNSIDKGTVKRLASLSDNGFYFLLAKLTSHFLRAG